MGKRLELTGQRFGRLVVLGDAPSVREPGRKAQRRVLCRCDCGVERIWSPGALRSGNTRSCGCMPRPVSPRTELIGQRFGRLVAFEELGYRMDSKGRRIPMWRLLCDCGGSTVIHIKAAISGNTRSCGCLKAERDKRLRRVTHGMTNTPEYQAWRAMLRRCCQPSDASYHNYGGRGVTVCDRWNPAKGGSFEHFYADMGDRPPGRSLDKDINGNGMLYSPETCCWATTVEQNRHKRNTRIIISGGCELRIDQIADIAGIPITCAQHRVRAGVSGPELFRPVRTSKEVSEIMLAKRWEKRQLTKAGVYPSSAK